MLIPLTDTFFQASIKKKNHLVYMTHGAVYTLRKYSCRMLKILRHHIAGAWEPCTRDGETFSIFFLYGSFNNFAAVFALLACARQNTAGFYWEYSLSRDTLGSRRQPQKAQKCSCCLERRARLAGLKSVR